MTASMANIRAWATVSNDFNPLHLDREFAAASPMQGIIAHGPMSTALLWQALDAALGQERTGRLSMDLRLKRPVRENDVVTTGGRLHDDQPGTWEVWVRNQDGETVISGTAGLRPL